MGCSKKTFFYEGRMIIADNFYTSVPLAEYLLSRKTDLCGTLRKNRIYLPLFVKSKKRYATRRALGDAPKVATNLAKKVSQVCNVCIKPYCLECFMIAHK